MSQLIPTNLFTQQLYPLIEEVFENTVGIILDKDASLFNTLGSISAEEASRPIVPGGSTIAAHVEHCRFYLDVMERYMRGDDVPKIDWKLSWQLRTVNAGEWESLKSSLREMYERMLAQMKSYEDWNNEKQLGGAMAIAAHTAYHVGAIRQILTVVKR